MSDPVETLIADLTERGVTLAAHSGRLRYHPRSALGPADVERLRMHKQELIARLSEPLSEDCLDDLPFDLFTSPPSRAGTAWWSGPEAEQGRRLNIMCGNPREHRTAWRSVFGPHLHCATCKWPPPSPDVVAEIIDLDSLLAGRRLEKDPGETQQ